MISSGEHEAEAVHVDAGDNCWGMVRDAPEENKRITPLRYLLAQHLVISARFHTQMEALLSPHGKYAALAPPRRADEELHPVACSAKTDGEGDYGVKALEAEGLEVHDPLCRHLKDVLRCTLVLADHAALGKAHAALLAKHTPVGTKDRRLLPPRDVLQTVWFEGWASSSRCSSTLPPVRGPSAARARPTPLPSHAAAAPTPPPPLPPAHTVMSLKVFSHAAYNITRVQTDNLSSIDQLFDHPISHLEEAKEARGRDQQAPLLIPVHAVCGGWVGGWVGVLWVCYGCAWVFGVSRRPVGKVVYNLELCSDTYCMHDVFVESYTADTDRGRRACTASARACSSVVTPQRTRPRGRAACVIGQSHATHCRVAMRAPPLVYHPRYSCPWPAAHRFPMWKFADLFDVVQRQRW